jgi:hypothetical protein
MNEWTHKAGAKTGEASHDACAEPDEVFQGTYTDMDGAFRHTCAEPGEAFHHTRADMDEAFQYACEQRGDQPRPARIVHAVATNFHTGGVIRARTRE